MSKGSTANDGPLEGLILTTVCVTVTLIVAIIIIKVGMPTKTPEILEAQEVINMTDSEGC